MGQSWGDWSLSHWRSWDEGSLSLPFPIVIWVKNVAGMVAGGGEGEGGINGSTLDLFGVSV